MGEENKYKEALEGLQVPVVTLDPKWHQLFEGRKKPQKVKELEKNLNELLKRQGKLNNEIKDLRKAKAKLMDEIVENMGTEEDHPDHKKKEKKMSNNQQLIKEINEKIEEEEEELMDIPRTIREVNQELMIESMTSCYQFMHKNSDDIFAIDEWVKKVREELKKNVLIKQEREAKNLQIYKYMHSILGPRVIDVFDMKYLKSWKTPDLEEEKHETSADSTGDEKK